MYNTTKHRKRHAAASHRLQAPSLFGLLSEIFSRRYAHQRLSDNSMDAKRLHRLRTELAQFVERLLPDNLGNRTRRRWAEVSLRGVLLDGDRQSIQPLAERLLNLAA
jgi:hypothetical protein